MAEEIKRYRVGEATELYIDRRNAEFPFLKNTLTFLERYVVDSDFTSGNNLRIDIDGAQTILKAIAKTPSNSFLTITETDLATETSDTTRQGISLTLGTAVTDVQVEIIVEV